MRERHTLNEQGQITEHSNPWAVQLASDLLSDRVGEEDFEVQELSEKQVDWASLCDLKP